MRYYKPKALIYCDIDIGYKGYSFLMNSVPLITTKRTSFLGLH